MGVEQMNESCVEAPCEAVDRRRLMLGGLAAVAGAGVVASVAEPAAAANGGSVLLGRSNYASATTRLATTAGLGLLATTAAAGQSGVVGRSNSSESGIGVRGIAATGVGVRGETSDASGPGVLGLAAYGSGVVGSTSGGYGVYATAADVFGWGAYGESLGDYGVGVAGSANGTDGYAVLAQAYGANATGVYSYAETGFAGYFAGPVHVDGELSKAGGSFRIDHPTDPENKYLSHSFVESPDMMNVYNGIEELDSDGQATVQMPDWFEALNRDFRYQLTPIGEFAPLYVSREMEDGKFSMAGGKQGQKVSWQVTGIRQDAWANAHRIPVEQNKPGAERGKFLHPDVVKGGKSVIRTPKRPKAPAIPKISVPAPTR